MFIFQFDCHPHVCYQIFIRFTENEASIIIIIFFFAYLQNLLKKKSKLSN